MIFMKALVIGAGGVGSAIANIAARRAFITNLVVADRDLERAEAAVNRLGDSRFSAARVNASSVEELRALIRLTDPDVVINAVDPRFVMPIFEACEIEGTNYVDMAMSLSKADPEEPMSRVGLMLGDEQFAKDDSFKSKGIYALVGIGVEPGLSDVFARYAADNLFSRIDSAIVYDGSNLVVEGYDFAPTFSIWTTIEECLNPPLMWERDRGWYTTEPFSDLESFDFPDGIGPVECVNVEHEEVALIPRKIDAGKVAFKYGLGTHFIDILKTIHILGLDKTEPVNVQGVSVSPRNVLAALLPDPATLGSRMSGKTCAGLQVKGLGKDGAPKAVYLYNVVDNAFTMSEFGDQAVVWQTAINPLIALELIARGDWKPAGVNGPEWFPAEPFLELLDSYGTTWHIRDESVEGIER
jgi:saccharopine dehydrogenase (NAD+, L-lysine-forming)